MLRSSFVAVLAALAAVPSIANAISVLTPNSQQYWVFGTSNQITWSTNDNANEPSPVSFTITNSNQDLLNGVFSISEYVDVQQKQYTVTDVTLRPGSGYVVNLVNPKNTSEIYATGAAFDVKPAGTPPYGATVYTVLSLSVNGANTETFTLVETAWSTASSVQPTATATNGTLVTITSSAAAGPATATIRHQTTSSATSLKTAGKTALALVSVAAGFSLLL